MWFNTAIWSEIILAMVIICRFVTAKEPDI